MSRIIVPSRRVWTRQPQGPVVGAPSSVILPSINYPDQVSVGTPVRHPSTGGIAHVHNGSSMVRRRIPGSIIGTGGGATLIAVWSTTTTATDRRFAAFGSDQGDMGNSIFSLGTGDNTASALRVTIGGSNTNDAAAFDVGTVNNGKLHCAALSVDRFSDSAPSLYTCVMDGSVLADSASTGRALGTLTTYGYVCSGGWRRGGIDTPAFVGGVLFVAPFAYALSAGVLRRYTQNPWQIIRPRTRRTIIDLGMSGLSSVYADSALTYYIRSLLSSDSGIQYAIRNAIYKDDAVGYFLRSAIAQNSEVGYVLRSAIAKDDAEAYKIRGLVQASDAEAYSIRGLVQASDGEAYKIRSQVQADTSTSYDIQSSTSVASSNAVNYSVRGVVAASVLVGYSVRGSAQRDAASAYSVRSAASRDVVASYAVSASASSVYADSTASYLVDGVVPSGPSAESIAAAVLAALQATTIPVDTKKMNGHTIIGSGTQADKFRGEGV